MAAAAPDTTAVVPVIPTALTLWGAPRPPAPANPFVYDADRDRREFCRALLNTKEAKEVEEEVKKSGFMTIEQVRNIVKNNTIKETMEARGEMYAIDPEILILIDSRTNYTVFIAGDNVYTREQLYAHLPFHDLQATPESVFVQQEIGVFPARKYAMAADEFEYVARDVGDETVEFVMIEDMVGQVARDNYKAKRAPVKIVKTKIFLGREKWDDFCLVHRVAKGMVNITGQNPRSSAFMGLLQGPPARPLLMDEATLAEQQRRMEEALTRREEEAKLREEAAKKREEETRKVEMKIQADMSRIEDMLRAMQKVDLQRARATRAHKPSAARPESAAAVAPELPDAKRMPTAPESGDFRAVAAVDQDADSVPF